MPYDIQMPSENERWPLRAISGCPRWHHLGISRYLEISGDYLESTVVFFWLLHYASLCFMEFSPLQSCQLPSTADLPISFGDAIGAGNTKAGSSTGSGSTAEILPRDDQIGTLMESKLQVKSLRTRQISTGHFTISVSNSFSVVF